MPTSAQITAAKAELFPQPYNAAVSKLDADAQATLLMHLRKYLSDTKQSGGYNQLESKLAAAVGIKAAQLKAVLNNVDDTGSKTAQLTGEVIYSTKENKDEELKLALLVMYAPVPVQTLGTLESDMAKRIRSQYCTCRGRRTCQCCIDEYRKTTSNC